MGYIDPQFFNAIALDGEGAYDQGSSGKKQDRSDAYRHGRVAQYPERVENTLGRKMYALQPRSNTSGPDE